MKCNVKKLVSLLLCFCLIGNLAVPAYAANSLGVTFQANLDTPVIQTSDTDQTVVMRVVTSEPVLLESISVDVVYDSALTIASISNDDSRIDFEGSTNSNRVRWDGTSNLDQLSDVSSIAVVTFTVPANTPAGTYEVGVQDIILTKDYGTEWESGASATTTLTITEATAADGYTASLNTLNSTVNVEDTVSVNVGISHGSDTVFAAGEIVVTYDNSLLSFNESASTLGSATVENADGTLTLEDYGADKNMGTGVYVLVFEAVSDGNATVEITSAAFVKKENAVKSDLIPAALSPAAVSVVINKQVHNVDLPDIFEGPATVTDGEDYTFSVADGENYDYDSITATVGGQTVDVIDNGDGTYTIENVTGEIVITGTREEKSYTVTISGNAKDDITDAADKATYNTDYSFTMPSADGWAYSLDSITIGGTVYTGYSVSDSVYTIPGSAINGDIVITVSKSQTIASVTVEGTGAGAAAGYETSASIGESYTLTIVPEAGYNYMVTATMNGTAATVIDNGNNTYTIANVTGNIVFTVNRSVVVDGVSVCQYLTLDGTIMWLVKNNTVVADGKVPTYDGANMFWSEKYDCYCYLALAETMSTEDAAEKVNITDGAAATVNYGMDVNITGKVDASDAQLVYNMYNVLYNTFTDDATVEKFLRADVNADSIVNVEDASAIIAAILG